jgi:hypothetical protein
MGNPSKLLVDAEGTVRQVIGNLRDAQEGLQKTGEAIKEEPVKLFLLAESLARAEFAESWRTS